MSATYPFPLAVHSSHHSLYHRFLLGAPAATLQPLPKPYCTGRLAEEFPLLAQDLTLPKWQRLYNGSFPWRDGFGPAAYDVRAHPPHRALPASYERPTRRFAAYDFVQIADPSLTALAIIGSDPRVVQGFLKINEQFASLVERQIGGRSGSSRLSTGRGLFGHFVEPNDRWLMPCLHAHARLLNFTSQSSAPRSLVPIDEVELARAGRAARPQWLAAQASLLRSLGYTVESIHDPSSGLIVRGVDNRLLASMEAPRIAVVKVAERLLGHDRWRTLADSKSPGAQPLLAAMVEHLESAIHDSVVYYRPPKLALPMDGPWKQSVLRYLQETCPMELLQLKAESKRAQGLGVFTDMAQPLHPAPADDACHNHATALESYDATEQRAADPDLPELLPADQRLARPNAWLAQAFEDAFSQVRSDIVTLRRPWPDAPRQRLLRAWDQAPDDAGVEAVRREVRSMTAALDREGRGMVEEARAVARRQLGRPAGSFLDELALAGRSPELAGRSRGRSL